MYFFFFQAEDGIRDPLVTGVQTCALPISAPARLDRTGDAKRVPQAPAEAEIEQQPLLCEIGAVAAPQQARRRIDQRPAAPREHDLPRPDRGPASKRARRDVGAGGVEPAMEAVAGLDLRSRIGMLAEKLGLAVGELGPRCRLPLSRNLWCRAASPAPSGTSARVR